MNPIEDNVMRYSQFALACLIGLSTLGCGGGELPTAPAGGVVTIDGEPLAGASVVSTPERGRAATGQTDAQGRYSLSTYGSEDGAIVGRHLVTVTSREVGVENSPGAPGLKRPGRSLIPEAYGSTATSGLTFNVAAEKENTFDINLTWKVGK